jgi:hypothetical protein
MMMLSIQTRMRAPDLILPALLLHPLHTGTDSFNIGQILMLLLFGASAEPPPCPESDDFLSAWGHRESLRKVLQLSPGEWGLITGLLRCLRHEAPML